MEVQSSRHPITIGMRRVNREQESAVENIINPSMECFDAGEHCNHREDAARSYGSYHLAEPLQQRPDRCVMRLSRPSWVLAARVYQASSFTPSHITMVASVRNRVSFAKYRSIGGEEDKGTSERDAMPRTPIT